MFTTALAQLQSSFSKYFKKKDLLHRKYVQHVQGQITKLFPSAN
jgi:hypothetical protein